MNATDEMKVVTALLKCGIDPRAYPSLADAVVEMGKQHEKLSRIVDKSVYAMSVLAKSGSSDESLDAVRDVNKEIGG